VAVREISGAGDDGRSGSRERYGDLTTEATDLTTGRHGAGRAGKSGRRRAREPDAAASPIYAAKSDMLAGQVKTGCPVDAAGKQAGTESVSAG